MSSDFDVAIIGAGPAGSSLAILLARHGRRVLLLEKESMPRDKLCGEFLSTEVEGICADLGVRNQLTVVGANPISRAICTSPDIELSVELPGTAHGVSRLAFDRLLFDRAAEAGALCRDGVAAQTIGGSLRSGFRIDTTNGSYSARAVVGAYGRRTSLDRKLERPSIAMRSPYVAFKAHFRGSFERTAIELHCFERGYCGMLSAEEGQINVCWIVHESCLRRAGGNPQELLAQMRMWSPRLDERMAGFTQLQPFLAVSQLSFRRKELFADDVLMIGDAAGMIAPLCGDGMGMAMRSAQIAAPLLEAFVQGQFGSAAVKHEYSRAWKKEFKRRMLVGRTLQRLCMRPTLLTPALRLAKINPHLARFVVKATRG